MDYSNILVTGGQEVLYPSEQKPYLMPTLKDEITGKFKRTHQIFSLENFNDGWIDNHGRFRVYFPTHPRSDKYGHILRAIVAFELYNNTSISSGFDVHHKDKNRLNDNKENLELIEHKLHTDLVNNPRREKSLILRTCMCCGKDFYINKWRLKDPNRGKFCSQTCYHKKGKRGESA